MGVDIPAWIGLLVQVPLVGVFIWFTLKMMEVFTNFLREQRQEFLTSLAEIASQLERMNDLLDRMNERLAVKQRQKPRSDADQI